MILTVNIMTNDGLIPQNPRNLNGSNVAFNVSIVLFVRKGDTKQAILSVEPISS